MQLSLEVYAHRRPRRDQYLRVLVDSLDIRKDREGVGRDRTYAKVREGGIATSIIQAVVLRVDD